MGGIGVYVGVMMVLSVLTTIQERPNYMGMIGLVWGIGTVLGPVIGGAFADSSATWRWAFYVCQLNTEPAVTIFALTNFRLISALADCLLLSISSLSPHLIHVPDCRFALGAERLTLVGHFSLLVPLLPRAWPSILAASSMLGVPGE